MVDLEKTAKIVLWYIKDYTRIRCYTNDYPNTCYNIIITCLRFFK